MLTPFLETKDKMTDSIGGGQERDEKDCIICSIIV